MAPSQGSKIVLFVFTHFVYFLSISRLRNENVLIELGVDKAWAWAQKPVLKVRLALAHTLLGSIW